MKSLRELLDGRKSRPTTCLVDSPSSARLVVAYFSLRQAALLNLGLIAVSAAHSFAQAQARRERSSCTISRSSLMTFGALFLAAPSSRSFVAALTALGQASSRSPYGRSSPRYGDALRTSAIGSNT